MKNGKMPTGMKRESVISPRKLKIIKKSDYARMLEEHDWYYMFSDDSRAYNAGYKNALYIRELADGNEEFARMYQEKYNKVYQNSTK